MKRQSLIAISVVVLAVAAALAVFWLRRPRRDVSPEFVLAPLLVKQHYVEVPLRRSKISSLDVAAKIEGESLLLYLDTGNTDNMIEPAVAQRLKLRSQRASHGIMSLLVLMDMTTLNGWRNSEGLPPWDGIMAADVLQAFSAVIDYGASKLFLRVTGGTRQ